MKEKLIKLAYKLGDELGDEGVLAFFVLTIGFFVALRFFSWILEKILMSLL